jgi:hypothetical protein
MTTVRPQHRRVFFAAVLFASVLATSCGKGLSSHLGSTEAGVTDGGDPPDGDSDGVPKGMEPSDAAASPETEPTASDAGADAEVDAVVATEGETNRPDGDGSSDAANDASEDGDRQQSSDGPGGAQNEAGDGGARDAASALGSGGEPDSPPSLFIFATTDDGGLWVLVSPVGSLAGPSGSLHTGVTSEGVQVSRVIDPTGSVGPVDDVEAQSVGRVVYALARRGSDLYISRLTDQTWAPWGRMGSNVKAMGAANLNGRLCACVVGTDGHLQLGRQTEASPWQDLEDVMVSASTPAGGGESPRALAKVDCVGMGADLEVLALDTDGALWEAVKRPTSWTPFRRIPTANGMSFQDIDAANAVGELHVLGSQLRDQFHAVRTLEGVWTTFSNVDANVGDPTGDVLAGAEASVLSEVDWLQLNSLGQIWISSRFRYLPSPYILLAGAAPGGRPFVSLSATSVLPY